MCFLSAASALSLYFCISFCQKRTWVSYLELSLLYLSSSPMSYSILIFNFLFSSSKSDNFPFRALISVVSVLALSKIRVTSCWWSHLISLFQIVGLWSYYWVSLSPLQVRVPYFSIPWSALSCLSRARHILLLLFAPDAMRLQPVNCYLFFIVQADLFQPRVGIFFCWALRFWFKVRYEHWLVLECTWLILIWLFWVSFEAFSVFLANFNSIH